MDFDKSIQKNMTRRTDRARRTAYQLNHININNIDILTAAERKERRN
jgi:hypothetical protein